jgi:hypothetical protein
MADHPHDDPGMHPYLRRMLDRLPPLANAEGSRYGDVVTRRGADAALRPEAVRRARRALALAHRYTDEDETQA